MNTRASAAKVLSQVIPRQPQQPGLHLDEGLQQAFSSLEPRDHSLLQEFCYGVCRHYCQLDYYASRLLKKPFKAKDTDLYFLLLVGFYQLYFMRIPDHAVISETVNACKSLKKTSAKGLINGVLRNAQRQRQQLLAAQPNLPAVRFNHPDWLMEKIKFDYPNQWQQILKNNNLRPPMVLRVNQQKTDRDHYLSLLQQHGIAAQAGQLCDEAIYLQQPYPVQQLPRFEQGFVSVQDEAAQLCANLLNVESHHRVLDACAAPGGKTAHLLEQWPDLDLLAIDINAKRLKKVRENLQRLDLNCSKVKLKSSDAKDTSQWWEEKFFDRILLDAPCSASGVIRRHPDIKWHRQGEEFEKLSAQQFDLLNALWPTLKPGGKLLYATCSIFKQENSLLIEKFLAQNDDAEQQAISLSPNPTLNVDCGYGVQLLAMENGTDGFYFAYLKKRVEQA